MFGQFLLLLSRLLLDAIAAHGINMIPIGVSLFSARCTGSDTRAAVLAYTAAENRELHLRRLAFPLWQHSLLLEPSSFI